MRKSFFAGLLTLLPVIITYIIIVFALGLITAPFEYFVSFVLKQTQLCDRDLGVFTQEQIIRFLSKILIILFLVGVIFLVGVLAAFVGFHSWGYYFEELVQKIPGIRNVYGPSKDLVNTFFNPPEEKPRKSVLVPYPSENQRTVGIITSEFSAILKDEDKEPQKYVSVLIPSTPNATGGYLCTFLKSEVLPFDLPAEEALKYIMSFGGTNLNTNTIAIKE